MKTALEEEEGKRDKALEMLNNKETELNKTHELKTAKASVLFFVPYVFPIFFLPSPFTSTWMEFFHPHDFFTPPGIRERKRRSGDAPGVEGVGSPSGTIGFSRKGASGSIS